jgi:hypothetical protein
LAKIFAESDVIFYINRWLCDKQKFLKDKYNHAFFTLLAIGSEIPPIDMFYDLLVASKRLEIGEALRIEHQFFRSPQLKISSTC